MPTSISKPEGHLYSISDRKTDIVDPHQFLSRSVPEEPPIAPGTPRPSPSEQRELPPSWTAEVLDVDVPSAVPFLFLDAFKGVRVKLVEIVSSSNNEQDNTLEFVGLDPNESKNIRVRDGMSQRSIPAHRLMPMRPIQPGDLVAPTKGELQGSLLRIVTFDEQVCSVKKLSTRLRKGQQWPTIATEDLVCVFPAYR